MSRIIVLKGGKSPEREVSLVSGAEIAGQLRLNGHEVIELDPAVYEKGHLLIEAIDSLQPDLVFIGLHGGDGENGVLQAMLNGSDIRFTGSGYAASAVAMDKLVSKAVAMQAQVPCPDWFAFDRSDYEQGITESYEDCLKIFRAANPSHLIVVKPADAGSSVGVVIVRSEEEWKPALEEAFRYSDRIMAEEFIEGRELTVTVLDGEALPVVEIRPRNGFYDYRNKYTPGNTVYVAPAELSAAESNMVRDYALRAWKAMGCSGYARFDFRYNAKTFFFLEANTLPGMTPLSLTPMAAKAVGITFPELLERIIKAANKQNITV